VRILAIVACATLWLGMAGASVGAPAFELPPPVIVTPLGQEQAAQSVKFARAAFQISEGAVWAYEGRYLTCGLIPHAVTWRASDWELDSARLASVFREEAGEAGFAAKASTNLFDTGPTAERYQIAALITGMDGRFCASDSPPPRFTGRLRMTVEWQLFDNLSRQVVKKIETTAGGEEKRLLPEGIERTFYEAFRQSTRALLASQEFRAALTAAGPTPTAAPARSALTYRSVPVAKRPIASAGEAVAAIFASDSLGSGFLISTEGYLLTNSHVVGTAKYVKVRWSDGRETVGEVIRADPRRDIAVVKADPGGRAPLALRPTAASLGEAVYAIGTPLDPKFQGSVTKGIVSATRVYEGLPYIQSDVTVNHGNSGGPLLDESGAVLGVTSWGVEISGAPLGVNLFIPIDDALMALALTPAG